MERGTHIDHILHPLPKHINREGKNVRDWVFDKCQRAEFGFISYAPNPAVIYYLDRGTTCRSTLSNILSDLNGLGKEVHVGRLEQREKHTSWHQSYLGHIFRLRDEVTGEILGDYSVQFNAINVVGVSPKRLQKREGIPERVEST